MGGPRDPLDDVLACPLCGREVTIHEGAGVECHACRYRVPATFVGDIPRQQRRRIAETHILRRLRSSGRSGIAVPTLVSLVLAKGVAPDALADGWWRLLGARHIVREGDVVREALGRH